MVDCSINRFKTVSYEEWAKKLEIIYKVYNMKSLYESYLLIEVLSVNGNYQRKILQCCFITYNAIELIVLKAEWCPYCVKQIIGDIK